MKRLGGRPLKLTADLQEALCNLIRVGNYAETSALSIGLGKTTCYGWMQKGQTSAERGVSGVSGPHSGGAPSAGRPDQTVAERHTPATLEDLHKLGFGSFGRP